MRHQMFVLNKPRMVLTTNTYAEKSVSANDGIERIRTSINLRLGESSTMVPTEQACPKKVGQDLPYSSGLTFQQTFIVPHEQVIIDLLD